MEVSAAVDGFLQPSQAHLHSPSCLPPPVNHPPLILISAKALRRRNFHFIRAHLGPLVIGVGRQNQSWAKEARLLYQRRFTHSRPPWCSGSAVKQLRLEQTKQTTIWFRRFQFNWILFSTAESIKRMKTLDKFIVVYKIYQSVLVQNHKSTRICRQKCANNAFCNESLGQSCCRVGLRIGHNFQGTCTQLANLRISNTFFEFFIKLDCLI